VAFIPKFGALKIRSVVYWLERDCLMVQWVQLVEWWKVGWLDGWHGGMMDEWKVGWLDEEEWDGDWRLKTTDWRLRNGDYLTDWRRFSLIGYDSRPVEDCRLPARRSSV